MLRIQGLQLTVLGFGVWVQGLWQKDKQRDTGMLMIEKKTDHIFSCARAFYKRGKMPFRCAVTAG